MDRLVPLPTRHLLTPRACWWATQDVAMYTYQSSRLISRIIKHVMTPHRLEAHTCACCRALRLALSLAVAASACDCTVASGTLYLNLIEDTPMCADIKCQQTLVVTQYLPSPHLLIST